MREKRAAVDADRAFLTARRGRWEHAACPACGGDSPVPFGEKLGFRYDGCGVCGTVYTNPRPSASLLGEFYAGSENYRVWNERVFPATEEARRASIFAPRAARLLSLLESAGVVVRSALDVGAAFGTFGVELRARGVARVAALEPTPGLAQTCRDRGLETIESALEDAEASGDFDLVTAFEVIEHVHDPAAFVRAATRWLAPNGVLALSCPSVEGVESLFLGAEASCFDHEHLNYFHPGSLARLLERCGLRVLETLTPGHLDVDLLRRAVADGRLDLASHPFLRHVLSEAREGVARSYQLFLAENLMSSHLWVVARRAS